MSDMPTTESVTPKATPKRKPPIVTPIAPNALARVLKSRNETRLAKLDPYQAGKLMRAFLRVRYADKHVHGTSWLLDRSQVDAVVKHFSAK